MHACMFASSSVYSKAGNCSVVAKVNVPVSSGGPAGAGASVSPALGGPLVPRPGPLLVRGRKVLRACRKKHSDTVSPEKDECEKWLRFTRRRSNRTKA